MTSETNKGDCEHVRAAGFAGECNTCNAMRTGSGARTCGVCDSFIAEDGDGIGQQESCAAVLHCLACCDCEEFADDRADDADE